MSAVTDFKSIKQKLDRMEQKAEWDVKNPKVEPSMYGYMTPLMTPFMQAILNNRLKASG